MTLTEHAPESWVDCGTVRVIGNTFTIWCFWVEVVLHVLLSQLAEGAGFEAKEFERLVEFGYVGCCIEVSVSGQKSVRKDGFDERPIQENMTSANAEPVRRDVRKMHKLDRRRSLGIYLCEALRSSSMIAP